MDGVAWCRKHTLPKILSTDSSARPSTGAARMISSMTVEPTNPPSTSHHRRGRPHGAMDCSRSGVEKNGVLGRMFSVLTGDSDEGERAGRVGAPSSGGRLSGSSGARVGKRRSGSQSSE